MHFLVVDANAAYRMILTDYLTHHFPESTVTVLPSADFAWTFADGLGIDLVITSQHLPDLTGVELIQLLHVRNPRLPIIMYSADLESRQEALAAGARAFVSKGQSLASLAEAIRQALPPTE